MLTDLVRVAAVGADGAAARSSTSRDRCGSDPAGRVWTPLGVPLPFEITEFDDGHAWAWKVVGVSATRHVVTAHSQGCRVSFGVPLWAPAYLPVCAVALKRIDELARA